MKKEYLVIFLILITEVLGFSLVLPFLPFYAEDLGASPFLIGLILTTFSVFQFISAPIMGRLSDHYGRRPLLMLSQLSTFLGFIILGLAKSIPMIFLSRAVDGLLGSNFTIAQAYLSDISTKKDRSRVFGLSGVAFGFGFMIGPAIGGFLAQINYSIPSFIAAFISFISILLTWRLLPETIKRPQDLQFKVKIIDFSRFKKYFSQPATSGQLWQLFSFLLTHALWASTFALFARRRFNVQPGQVGFFLTYIGLISILFRGVILGKLIKAFGEEKLQIAGMILVMIGLVTASLITQAWLLLLVMTFFAIGAGMLRPLIIGNISRSVSEKEQGAILGVTNSLGSLSQIIGPLAGGFLINYLAPASLGIFAAAIMLVGFFFFFYRRAGISSLRKCPNICQVVVKNVKFQAFKNL